MVGRRRALLILTLVATALAAGCGRIDRSRHGADVERGLARGRGYAATWIARGRGAAQGTSEAAIALGYLERLRLGLGSPFRLMDYALRDPRLADSTRVHLAWALLARTLDGHAYQVDPAALNRVGLAGVGATEGVGRRHLELIEGVLTEARDPRGGELAVRLAYALARAERSVGGRGLDLAAQAAALIRDRELARADALRLIRAAEAAGTDPIRLAPAWRNERRFEVERPPMAPLPTDVEREAMELAPHLASAIQALGPRLAGELPSMPTHRPGSAPLLGPAAARLLAGLADSLNAPPQTAVAIAVDMHHRELLEHPALSEAERAALRRFVDRAKNEERFVAEHALLLHHGAPAPAATARAALAAAVGLRPYAQERVWFPGFGGPTARELEDRFGLASVRFGEEVPAAWRPFYRRMLAEALADLQRVLPSLELRGLRISFDASRGKAATLAVHDPRRRTIFLPPATGAGTIAHEVAHDLDWQVALRRYRVRGDYGSDRATRQGRDRLALSVRRLTTGALVPPTPGDATPVMHARRPAEVFARSVDWFVVVSLAGEGRVNGYLSSVQDDLLTGYGTVTPPDITGEAGHALITILDEVAPVYPATREWFLRSYGLRRALTSYDLVRRVIETAAGEDRELLGDATVEGGQGQTLRLSAAGAAMERFAALEEARDAAFAAIDTWICRAPTAAYDPRLEIARRRLVARAAGARARGLALLDAAELAGEDGRRWLARQFYGAPRPMASVDSATADLLNGLVEQAHALGEVQIDAAPGAFHLAAAPRHCAGAPLMVGG